MSKTDNSVYKAKGYSSRKEYLDELAQQYCVPMPVVYSLASMLGPNEDFDGLVNALEDMN